MANNRFVYTTQHAVRVAFWNAHPEAVRRPGSQNAQPTDTRVAFVDYVNQLSRAGEISGALAQRVTL